MIGSRRVSLGSISCLGVVVAFAMLLSACTNAAESTTSTTLVDPSGPGYGKPGTPIGGELKSPEGTLILGVPFENTVHLLPTGDPFDVMRNLVGQLTAEGFTTYADHYRSMKSDLSDSEYALCVIGDSTKATDQPNAAVPLNSAESVGKTDGGALGCYVEGVKAVYPNSVEQHSSGSTEYRNPERIAITLNIGESGGFPNSSIRVYHSDPANGNPTNESSYSYRPEERKTYIPDTPSPIQPPPLRLPEAGGQLAPKSLIPLSVIGETYRVAEHSMLMAPPRLHPGNALEAIFRVDQPDHVEQVFNAYIRQIKSQVHDLTEDDIKITRETVDGVQIYHADLNEGASAGDDDGTSAVTAKVDPRVGAFILFERYPRA